ncbi:hypothetical protein BOTBODRAFT_32741 [Botryobasidium botryosum FD-172 SS1]|uniref:Uncharacterized protein n=1 Tax=Botryobasidium botryosum (strain FD-172 SS1) TaxID=930990 RepID=A0A067MQY1_BOTB1|nr:hypothetical protein BOTBODRAFT_32741 [Botryobasidium botryosum FD-172 SS1]
MASRESIWIVGAYATLVFVLSLHNLLEHKRTILIEASFTPDSTATPALALVQQPDRTTLISKKMMGQCVAQHEFCQYSSKAPKGV